MEPALEQPWEAIRECEDVFVRAAMGEDAIANVAQGISLIISALQRGTERLQRSQADQLILAICHAGRPLSDAVHWSLSHERVLLGLSGAVGVVRLLAMTPEEAQQDQPLELAMDRFDHAVLLSLELAAILRHQAIKERGDVLARHMAIHRAAIADAASMLLH